MSAAQGLAILHALLAVAAEDGVEAALASGGHSKAERMIFAAYAWADLADVAASSEDHVVLEHVGARDGARWAAWRIPAGGTGEPARIYYGRTPLEAARGLIREARGGG